jgi:hypothetical protein
MMKSVLSSRQMFSLNQSKALRSIIGQDMKAFFSSGDTNRPTSDKIRRNRNVHQDEQEATLGNILEHFSLIGPFPVLTENQAVRIKGLAELYVLVSVFFFFSLSTLVRSRTRPRM